MNKLVEVSRIIVRQEGVGLSMLRNITVAWSQTKRLRNNQHLSLVFFTFLYKISVFLNTWGRYPKIHSFTLKPLSVVIAWGKPLRLCGKSLTILGKLWGMSGEKFS